MQIALNLQATFDDIANVTVEFCNCTSVMLFLFSGTISVSYTVLQVVIEELVHHPLFIPNYLKTTVYVYGQLSQPPSNPMVSF